MISVRSTGYYVGRFLVPSIGLSGSICWGSNNSMLFGVQNEEAFYGHVRLCEYPLIVPTTMRARSRSMSPLSLEQTDDRLATGTIIGMVVGAVVFSFTVLAVILLSKLRDRCESVSGNSMNVVPVNTLTSAQYPSQYGEGLM
jgi:hypothetical protein